jgi:hypothetical protein
MLAVASVSTKAASSPQPSSLTVVFLDSLSSPLDRAQQSRHYRRGESRSQVRPTRAGDQPQTACMVAKNAPYWVMATQPGDEDERCGLRFASPGGF